MQNAHCRVQNLESASNERQRMLASLVQMVRDLGIAPLAEGVELAADHEICRQIGVQFGQGFYYGYPELPKRLLAGGSASVSESTISDMPPK